VGAVSAWRGAYLRQPYRRLAVVLDEAQAARNGARHAGEQPARIAFVPLIRVAGDVAKMIGYPVGLWWRLKNRRRTGARSR